MSIQPTWEEMAEINRENATRGFSDGRVFTDSACAFEHCPDPNGCLNRGQCQHRQEDGMNSDRLLKQYMPGVARALDVLEATVMGATDNPKTDDDLLDGIPFGRRSCTFEYCPHPEACVERCDHPHGRGPTIIQLSGSRADVSTLHEVKTIAELALSADMNKLQRDNLTNDVLDHIIDREVVGLSQSKVVDYKVVTGNTPGELRAEVLGLLSEGYTPRGGVSHSYFCYQPSVERSPLDLWMYSQAMVLYGDDTPLDPDQVPFIPFTE